MQCLHVAALLHVADRVHPLGSDPKLLESSRPVIRSLDTGGPAQNVPDKDKFKQEPKTPVAPKKVGWIHRSVWGSRRLRTAGFNPSPSHLQRT